MTEQTALTRTAVQTKRVSTTFTTVPLDRQETMIVWRRGYRALLTDVQATSLRFEVFGAVCRRDEYGEHFNFPQRWTPYPGVVMSTLFGDSSQTRTLAINLLDYFLRSNAAVRSRTQPSQLTVELSGSFAHEILAPMAGLAWHLPADSLRNWIEIQSGRALRRRRRRG